MRHEEVETAVVVDVADRKSQAVHPLAGKPQAFAAVFEGEPALVDEGDQAATSVSSAAVAAVAGHDIESAVSVQVDGRHVAVSHGVGPVAPRGRRFAERAGSRVLPQRRRHIAVSRIVAGDHHVEVAVLIQIGHEHLRAPRMALIELQGFLAIDRECPPGLVDEEHVGQRPVRPAGNIGERADIQLGPAIAVEVSPTGAVGQSPVLEEGRQSGGGGDVLEADSAGVADGCRQCHRQQDDVRCANLEHPLRAAGENSATGQRLAIGLDFQVHHRVNDRLPDHECPFRLEFSSLSFQVSHSVVKKASPASTMSCVSE